jgi:hypothetical protein
VSLTIEHNMKNLVSPLENAGLSHEQVLKSIQVVYHWVEDHYPVLAVTARKPLKEAFPEIFQKRPKAEEVS